MKWLNHALGVYDVLSMILTDYHVTFPESANGSYLVLAETEEVILIRFVTGRCKNLSVEKYVVSIGLSSRKQTRSSKNQ